MKRRASSGALVAVFGPTAGGTVVVVVAPSFATPEPGETPPQAAASTPMPRRPTTRRPARKAGTPARRPTADLVIKASGSLFFRAARTLTATLYDSRYSKAVTQLGFCNTRSRTLD